MCQGLAAQHWQGLHLPMPLLDDAEAGQVPTGLDVLDAHVHLFPPRVIEAIWRWFEKHAWQIRYKLHAEATIAFLQARGVRQLVGLHYAHVPGLARSLNAFAADLGREHAGVIPFGTVLPGEPEAEAIAAEAFEVHGLAGLKLHCHVQRFAPDDPALDGIYRQCVRHGKPLVVHAGREPALPGYPADIPALCNVTFVRRVLERHPELKLVVPHLGADEIPEYLELLDAFPNLHLDTTMMLAGYFPQPVDLPGLAPYAGRLLYGSDFPNLPYAWDRELKVLASAGFEAEALAAIAGGNARRLLGL